MGDRDIAVIRELQAQVELLCHEMREIALALGRSSTDGESDCDWHDMAGDIAQLVQAIAAQE